MVAEALRGRHDAYQRALERLLRDLRVETADAASG
jgi:hypothetical protein